MIHAMIDTETLNVGIRAPIFEIGVTIFDVNGTERAFGHWHLDLLDVILKTGFCPNQDTISWWQKQEYDPTDAKNRRVTLSDSLEELSVLMNGNSVEKVWANSPSFDLVLLEQHYQAVCMDAPWTYKQELDFRTIRWLAEKRGWENPMPHPDHNALNDARLQRDLLLEMLTHV